MSGSLKAAVVNYSATGNVHRMAEPTSEAALRGVVINGSPSEASKTMGQVDVAVSGQRGGGRGTGASGRGADADADADADAVTIRHRASFVVER